MQEQSIQQFQSEQFGTIRTTTIDGEPWFVVSDICACFGIANRNRVLQQVDDEDKGGTQMDTPGGMQTITVVNESGLYAILFYIQPTKARGLSKEEIEAKYKKVKDFKRWVTHEVLPSIRKHGGYIEGQQDFIDGRMTNEEMVLRSMKWLTSVVEEQKRNIADLKEQNAALTEDNAKMLPKAVVYDAIMSADGTTTVTHAARYMTQVGTDMNSHRLYALLRADGIVCKTSNAPTKKAVTMGLGKQMMTYRADGTANPPYIRLTQAGIAWCISHYCNVCAVA